MSINKVDCCSRTHANPVCKIAVADGRAHLLCCGVSPNSPSICALACVKSKRSACLLVRPLELLGIDCRFLLNGLCGDFAPVGPPCKPPSLLIPSRIGSQTMSCTALSSQQARAGIGSPSPLGSHQVVWCQLACRARVVDLSVFEIPRRVEAPILKTRGT